MLANYLYPIVCGFCGKVLEKGAICEKCKENIPYYGYSPTPFSRELCFDKLYCNYEYTGIVRKKMLDFKFEHQKYLCRTFAEGMICGLKNVRQDFDFILPVPVHRLRRKERGYNQSELIAKIVAKELKIPCQTKILLKSKANHKQSKLNMKQRASNVKGVFEVKNAEMIKGKRLLLIDDIFTTGATVNECSKVLKEAGAKEVVVYTVAKASINSHID